MAVDQRTAPYAALLLRVTLGVLAILHLYWKFYVRQGGFDGWWNGLEMAGYPQWVILYVLSGEFAGAICLIPGIYTRWVALYAMPLMVGAAQFWLARTGFFFTAAGAEMPVLCAIALIVQARIGDGAYALIPSPKFPFIGGQRRAMQAE